MTPEIPLILLAFGTSTITAITGIGGGMILIAVMPGFLPGASIVPVHAMAQLFANSSRALFGWRFLRWEFVLAFIAGSIGGGLIAAGITREINLEYTPLIIATYILFTVWGPKVEFRKPIKGEFVAIGLVQTGLSMLVGATDPVGQAVLLSKGLQCVDDNLHPPDKNCLVCATGFFIYQLLGNHSRHVHRGDLRRPAGHPYSL